MKSVRLGRRLCGQRHLHGFYFRGTRKKKERWGKWGRKRLGGREMAGQAGPSFQGLDLSLCGLRGTRRELGKREGLVIQGESEKRRATHWALERTACGDSVTYNERKNRGTLVKLQGKKGGGGPICAVK